MQNKQKQISHYLASGQSSRFRLSRLSRAGFRAAVTLAVVVLLVGLAISIMQWRANQLAADHAAKQVAAANRGVDNGVPSTTKPKPGAFAAYMVAPAQPRYLFIPKLSVQAIVRPLGLLPSGQLKAPTNVYDTGWYSGSSKPGQPGATLIDGHISSWTTHGVFYGLKQLKPGDRLQIERGDGSKVSYTVTKTKVYSANNVNMAEALSPVNPKVSGLNLMSCTGQVIPGTSEFNQRVVVFAEQA